MTSVKEKRLLAATRGLSADKRDDMPSFKRKVLSKRLLSLTRKRAKEVLEMPTFDGERNLNTAWAQALRDLMSAGLFLPELARIVLCKCGRKNYRLDGQHTCEARLSFPAAMPIDCKVEVIQYQVATENDLRILYSLIDANKPRTPQHRVRAILTGNDGISGIWPSLIGTLSSGLKFWQFPNREEARRTGPNEIANLIAGKHKNIFVNVGKFYQDNYDQTHIKRMAVHAAMFATFNAAPRKAKEFWEKIATGEQLRGNDIRLQLRDYLTHMVQVYTKPTNIRRRHVLMAEDLYRLCILAWNDWRDGTKNPKLKVREAINSNSRPKPI